MKPAEVQVGQRVRYSPVAGVDESFLGTVRDAPFLLGTTWVVHLHEMESAYGEYCGRPGKSTVHAAALSHLEAVVDGRVA